MPPLAPPTSIALVLGGVTFADFEVPEEIDHFGGTQSMAVHRFPGGEITVQEMGAFPPEVIRWSGVLMNYTGVDLNDRVQQIDQMRTSGLEQQLSFGRFTYNVLVRAFRPAPHNIFRYPYTIELVPFEDLTQTAIAPPIAPSMVAQLQQQNGSLQNTIQNAPTVVPPPAPAIAALTNFQQGLSNALQQALGNPGLINTPTLQGLLDTAKATVLPLINSVNSGVAAFSLQANNTLSVVNDQLNPAAGILNTINVVNPNLFQLAEQYYGDATQWSQIASANQLMTPFPIGIFKLIVPQLAAA